MNTDIFSIAQIDNEIHMTCEAEFSVSNAVVIKQALQQSAARKGDETLSLTKARSIDLTGIQLAFAWRAALKIQGRNAKVLLPEAAPLKDLLQKAGITQIF
jgi:hypothetical protein